MSHPPEPDRGILDEVEARIIAAERAEQSTEVRHGDDNVVLVLGRTVGRMVRRVHHVPAPPRRTEGQS